MPSHVLFILRTIPSSSSVDAALIILRAAAAKASAACHWHNTTQDSQRVLSLSARLPASSYQWKGAPSKAVVCSATRQRAWHYSVCSSDVTWTNKQIKEKCRQLYSTRHWGREGEREFDWCQTVTTFRMRGGEGWKNKKMANGHNSWEFNQAYMTCRVPLPSPLLSCPVIHCNPFSS